MSLTRLYFSAEDSGLVVEKVDYSAPRIPRNPDLPRSFATERGGRSRSLRGRSHLSHRSQKSRTSAAVLTFPGRIRVCGRIWCIGMHRILPQARKLPDLLWGRARVGGAEREMAGW